MNRYIVVCLWLICALLISGTSSSAVRTVYGENPGISLPQLKFDFTKDTDHPDSSDIVESFGEHPYYTKVITTNTRDQQIRMWPMGTPFEGNFWDSVTFVNRGNKEFAEYIGPMAQRSFQLEPKDMINIEPGSVSTFDLEIAYNYIFPGDGNYWVSYETLVAEIDGSIREPAWLNVVSTNMGFMKFFNTWENWKDVEPLRVTPASENREIKFIDCSEDQKVKILEGLFMMRELADIAYKSLGDPSACQNIFSKWFGNSGRKSTSYVETVRSNFRKIKSVDGEAFVCGNPKCSNGLNTWFTPRDLSHTVYVCPRFFDLSEEQAGMSLLSSFGHFDDIAKLRDYAFGEKFHGMLAQRFPTQKIINNADSYSLFARDTWKNREIDHVIADI